MSLRRGKLRLNRHLCLGRETAAVAPERCNPRHIATEGGNDRIAWREPLRGVCLNPSPRTPFSRRLFYAPLCAESKNPQPPSTMR
jgi:hypothetical protein